MKNSVPGAGRRDVDIPQAVRAVPHPKNCLKAGPAHGEDVAKALGIELFEPQTA
jgi:hypothetical protein